MKNGVILMVYLLSLSCSNTEESTTLPEGLPQLWKLTSVNLGLSGEIVFGDEILYQETIELRADSTFIKIRLQDDETKSAMGTFGYQEKNGENYLVLTNAARNDLIVTCSDSLKEWFLLSTTTTMSGGGLPCDAPGLSYERID